MGRPTQATTAGQAFLALRSKALSAGRTTAEYLRLYALKGFLLRLANSSHKDRFVLKGGVLLADVALPRLLEAAPILLRGHPREMVLAPRWTPWRAKLQLTEILPADFRDALKVLRAFADPVLTRVATDSATWNPDLEVWEDADSDR
jgi:hypothetical protein